MNFPDARIYKIKCNITNKIYIGSTYSNNLRKRLCMHYNSYLSFLRGNYHYISSFDTLQNDNFDIELVQLFPCNNRHELHIREGYHIQNTVGCINRNVAGRTHAECVRRYQLKIRNNNNI